MPLYKLPAEQRDKLLKVFTLLIISFGIIVRVVMLCQNRNLFIDEANLARNIYERPFMELLRPLDYEQYAAPLYLWVVKVFTLLFGYSEWAYRIYSLLAGVGSLLLLFDILRCLTGPKAYWYPVFLLANAFIFIQYSTELKQYMSDAMVVLFLLWMAIRYDIADTPIGKFLIYWTLAGTIAIWLAMPSVFALAGVGGFYISECIRRRDTAKIKWVAVISILWLVQFAFYYVAILKAQANSTYLQKFHEGYFIHLLPKNISEWRKNKELLKDLVRAMGGSNDVVWLFNAFLLLVGGLILIKKNTSLAVLLIIPIVFLLVASGLHQYSLITRVALFILPVFLIVVGYGFYQILNTRYFLFTVPVIGIALLGCYKIKATYLMTNKWEFENISSALNFLKQNNVPGEEVYVHIGARPAFFYYTQINPKHAQWSSLSNAHMLAWDASYSRIADTLKTQAAFVYTAIGQEQLNDYKEVLDRRLKLKACIDSPWVRCYVFIYEPK